MQLSSSSLLSCPSGFRVLFQRIGRWTEHGLLIVQQVHESFPDCVNGSCVCWLNDRMWSSFGSQEQVDVYIRATVLSRVESVDMKTFCDLYREEINVLNVVDRQKRSSKSKQVDDTRLIDSNNVLKKKSLNSVVKKRIDRDSSESMGDGGSRRVIIDDLYVAIVCDNDRSIGLKRKVSVTENDMVVIVGSESNEKRRDCDRQRRRREIMNEKEMESYRERRRHQNMSDSEIERHRKRNRHDDMSDSEIERHRERNRHDDMSDSEIERHRKRNRHGDMSDSHIERHRERNRHSSGKMTVDSVEKHIHRNRLVGLSIDSIARQHNSKLLENLSLEQAEHQRGRHQVTNMTRHELQQKHFRNHRAQCRAKHVRLIEQKRISVLNERIEIVMNRRDKLTVKSLSLTWCHMCEHCRFTYLSSVEKGRRNLCCDNGRMLNFPEYRFQTISDTMYDLVNNNLADVNWNSLYYNSILSLGCTMVDNRNDPVDPQKWVHMHGPHAVKIHGTTRHFLHSITYITKHNFTKPTQHSSSNTIHFHWRTQ